LGYLEGAEKAKAGDRRTSGVQRLPGGEPLYRVASSISLQQAAPGNGS
jgi:hypothetical protein